MADLDMTNKVVVKNWSQEVSIYAQDQIPMRDLIGGRKSAIYRPRRLTGEAGNSTTVQLRYGGMAYIKGNQDTRLGGTSTTKYAADTVALDQINVSYTEGRARESIEAQSVAVDLAENAKEQIAEDMKEWFSKSFFSQLSGELVKTTDDRAAQTGDGNNALVAPTNTIALAADANILDGVIDAIKTAKNLKVNPISGLDTGSNWVLYMSPTEEAALRKYAKANSWFDLNAAISIAEKNGRTLSEDLIGKAYGVELRSNYHCPEGKMFFLGAQALLLQVGEGFDDLFHTNFEIWDGTIAAFKAWTVAGLKKTQYLEKDFGAVQLTVAAAGGGGQSAFSGKSK